MLKKFKYRLPKRQYFQYLALLLVSFILFTSYALMPDDIDISLVLKKRNLQNAFVQNASTPQSIIDSTTANKCQQDSAQTDYYILNGILDTSHQRFLLIGDSMGEYLRLRLNDYCTKNGHTMQSVIWYSSTTESYGTSDTLAHFIQEYKPTYVLITLGSNELFARNIKEKRDSYVKHILEQIGNIPYVWIGPPNWKEDTGINDLIVENVGDGRYFESKKLTFQRGKDHAHPVRSSAFKWMDSIADYLYHDAAHRVTMEFPDKAAGKLPSTVILPPSK